MNIPVYAADSRGSYYLATGKALVPMYYYPVDKTIDPIPVIHNLDLMDQQKFLNVIEKMAPLAIELERIVLGAGLDVIPFGFMCRIPVNHEDHKWRLFHGIPESSDSYFYSVRNSDIRCGFGEVVRFDAAVTSDRYLDVKNKVLLLGHYQKSDSSFVNFRPTFVVPAEFFKCGPDEFESCLIAAFNRSLANHQEYLQGLAKTAQKRMDSFLKVISGQDKLSL